MSWNVHRVRPQDAARMRALRLEMLADSPLAFLETLAQAAERSHASYRQRVVQASRGDSLAQFVADPGEGERLIGHAGGTISPDFPGETVIFAVYVTPAHRGGKVVADLIEAVAAWSTSAGRLKTLLEVVVGNNRALRAYEKLGFTDTGERVPHPVIPALTELRMRRSV
ncbi:GNAT family N-acetyltransferase [Paractinoplanes brasiliensis]|uniref:Ribosomal protein S18 acetylase RimI-like enzyme n=1 Tax=Paractinoplanes brasiliensis TaxID=52695 RepID=A0A4R6JYT2_9ACTN|nr:GNAT family N-acetyltransferase [Actinoplanes brasiliensis]TDO39945.1 ribosomal protein S18 acetylase RimI-like enzyme [Actinoplanes brasiliensis]GID31567.1 N-acetyltransferase [Actinoplanes brasiliensis]